MCQKTSVLQFWCSLWFADFRFFSIWFSAFVKNTCLVVFWVWYPICFFLFILFGFGFFRFDGQLILNSRKMSKLLRGMREKQNVTVGDHVPRMMPETLPFQTREIIWSVSNMLPTPATEGAIVDCIAFFYEEGKCGENFRKKNTLSV